MRRPIRSLWPLTLALTCATAAHAGVIVDYDAGLGVLPQARGWTFVDGSGAPAPSVSGGALLPGATSQADTRWWERSDVAFAFDAAFGLEAVLQVTTSEYRSDIAGASQRSGFYIDLVDSAGRRLALGIASGGITLNTDLTLQTGNGIPFLPFNTTDAFHRYQLAVVADSAILSIDGVRRGATPLGGAIDPPDARRVYFGDGSGSVASQVAIRWVRYGDPHSSAGVGTGPHRDDGALRIVALGSPSAREVTFEVRAAAAGRARLTVWDLQGRRIADLGEFETGPAGMRLRWDGRSGAGRRAGAGVYVVVATAGDRRASCRAVLRR